MSLPPLRPRSAGEILDVAFQFNRAYYSALVLGVGALLLPPILLGSIFPDLALLWKILGNLSYLAATAVPVVMVTDYYAGQPVDVSSTLSRVSRRFPSIWGAAIYSGLVTVIGFVLFIVPGVIAMARLFAMPSVVMAEGANASESFERSRELTRGSFWHIAATLGVAHIIFWVVSLGMGIVTGVGAAQLGMSPTGAGFIAETLMIGLYPFVGVVGALLYIDLRVKKEALDVQLMAAALEPEPEPVLAG
jgi:hypothetical protein